MNSTHYGKIVSGGASSIPSGSVGAIKSGYRQAPYAPAQTTSTPGGSGTQASGPPPLGSLQQSAHASLAGPISGSTTGGPSSAAQTSLQKFGPNSSKPQRQNLTSSKEESK